MGRSQRSQAQVPGTTRGRYQEEGELWEVADTAPHVTPRAQRPAERTEEQRPRARLPRFFFIESPPEPAAPERPARRGPGR